MSEDTRRVVTVAAVIVLSVAAVLLLWRRHESLRPQLLSASVVFWAEGEDVAREDLGVRPAHEPVWAGVLLQFRQGEGPVRVLCPFPRVQASGQWLQPEPLAAWPSRYGVLKAQWFTVEPAFFGWENVDATTMDKLAYGEFAAPEMGAELKAAVTAEAHNDDFLAKPVAGNTLGGGTVRLKVKVSAYARPEDLLPWASVASPGAREVDQAPALVRAISLPPGIHPDLVRVLRLGVFTFAPGVWPDGGPSWPLPWSPRRLVLQHLITTPQAVAAMAAVGDPLAEPWGPPGRLAARAGRWVQGDRWLVWGRDVAAGDALTWDGRWAVAWSDDGDGVLSFGDNVLVAWMQPPRLVSLAEIAEVTSTLELRRVERGRP